MFKVGTGEAEAEKKFGYVWKKLNEEQKAIEIET